jgi:hypothetical protein
MRNPEPDSQGDMVSLELLMLRKWWLHPFPHILIKLGTLYRSTFCLKQVL